MTMTDPIADMLTRIRNAVAVKHRNVDVPHSKLKVALAAALRREGFIQDYEVKLDGKSGVIRIALRYDADGASAITSLVRESKPGRRIYKTVDAMPKILGGLGIAVLSTPKGLLSDREARREKVGGEHLCSVY